MSYIVDTLDNLVHQTAFFNLTWGNYLMIVVACFFLYLAIAKEFQNRHYGSRALKLVLEEYLKGKMMFGCVEALIPEAENYQQRVNRVRFFRRNGLFLLDGVIDGGERGKFQFICTDPNVTFEQLNAQFVTYKVE